MKLKELIQNSHAVHQLSTTDMSHIYSTIKGHLIEMFITLEVELIINTSNYK